MEPFHESRPADHVALQMENELLVREVAHLRARLAHGSSGTAGDGPVDERHERAYHDLTWLLGRLESSPARPILRRFDGFNILVDRYLGTDA